MIRTGNAVLKLNAGQSNEFEAVQQQHLLLQTVA
jgi:hypothetical protein